MPERVLFLKLQIAQLQANLQGAGAAGAQFKNHRGVRAVGSAYDIEASQRCVSIRGKGHDISAAAYSAIMCNALQAPACGTVAADASLHIRIIELYRTYAAHSR